ncbi:MAG TPA: helix-turn-helix domain-containing protein [Vicinamibacterales bacterium]|nr:helix-turn-helix domain-containing protein [Vicinamibacterales bacterium]HOG30449.1 helix-turn-helix domain-containing protein [Vicinamibacterales bacterium]HOQ60806.1 helix-turn-helix domain-containing protein [Vicinamibacterales bacterium]HPK71847.1 helix-turn-helix domain-containing protein [Vicinamibacterales bacterium]HPW22016.1 helix-turn-helix domain-containing protein [Vicinamibacterales bacterium]
MGIDQRTFDALDRIEARSLSLAQACTALHVSRRTVYYLIKEGRLATVRTPLGSQRVLVESLRAVRMEREARLADRGSDGFRRVSCGN